MLTSGALAAMVLAACGPEGVPPLPPLPGDAEPAATPSATTTAAGERGDLLLDGDFETCDLSQFDGREALDHELTRVGDPLRSGACALRVEVNADEENQGGGRWRAELTHEGAGHDPGTHDQERWFGLSTYLPEDYPDGLADIVFQIHERPGDCEEYRSPPLYLRVGDGQMTWKTRWDSKRCSDGNEPEGTANVSSAPIVRGRWVDWVVHVRWSYESDGLVEVWQDGRQVARREGPNTYNDEREQYLKVGSYWLSGQDDVDQRVSFVDEVRMAGPGATYDDVAPR